MAVVQITINIVNAPEIVTKEKGKFTGLLASLVMDEKTLKTKVEEKVCLELIKRFKESVGPGLIKEGIKANINYAVILREEIKVV